MPLLKLWKSLRGRRSAAAAPESAGPAVYPAKETAAAQPAAADPGPGQKAAPAAKQTPASRGVLGIGRRSPHAALCKLVRPLRPVSVLEISVGDGSRAAAVLRTLAKEQPETPLRYVAIDQFELAGGPVTLKQFHQRLRQEGIRPQVFPDSVERALTRVAHTVGAVDLVLIADASDAWQTPQRQWLLDRVTHRESVILRLDGDQWRRESGWGGSLDQQPRRAAA